MIFDLYISMTASCLRAGLLFNLPLLSLWKGATPSCGVCRLSCGLCRVSCVWFGCVLFVVDCAFEPVGEFDGLLSIRSWVHPVMAAMPSLTRFPMFSCLCSATIVGNPVRLSDLATTDSATMRLLSAPNEPSVAGLVEVNWVTTIAGLRSQLVLVQPVVASHLAMTIGLYLFCSPVLP
jgi:hypothetical protein